MNMQGIIMRLHFQCILVKAKICAHFLFGVNKIWIDMAQAERRE